MPRRMRETYLCRNSYPERRRIAIAVGGTSWKEVFEACIGFLADEEVPIGHFAVDDLELLMHYGEKRLHAAQVDLRRHCPELEAAREKRMNDRSELVKEARQLADRVEPDLMYSGEVDMAIVPHQDTCKDSATMLRRLADTIEEHDKVPSFAENIKALRRDIDSLKRRSSGQAANVEDWDAYVNSRLSAADELHAACKTCNEAIENYQNTPTTQTGPASESWIRLKAAGHLAKQAVEKVDEVVSEEKVKASLIDDAVRQIKSGDNDFMDADEFKVTELNRERDDVVRRIRRLECEDSGPLVTKAIGQLWTKHKQIEDELKAKGGE